MTELSPPTLRNLGTEARGEYTEITGNCRNIALDIQTLLRTRFDVSVDVVELQVGTRRDTHYVNKLDSEHFTDADKGVILLDAALDQFCTENQHHDEIRVDFGPRETLPAVALYLPGAEERHLWYYKPNNPNEGQDVFTGDTLSY